MKIAFIIPALVNKGPVLIVQSIVRNLIDRVELIDVYYFDRTKESIDFLCNTYKISFFSKIDFSKYDIIHSHMLRPDAFIWYHRDRINAICISTIHQNIKANLKYSYNGLISFIFSRLWYKFLRSQNALVVLSRVMKAEYEISFKSIEIFPIYNGRTINVDFEIENSDQILIENFSRSYRTIGTVANITNTKGIDQLIKYLSFDPNYGLIVVGEGKNKIDLINLAKKFKVDERCLFLGYRISGYRYIKYFDIYAMPSRAEGFGLALIEASQYFKPILCSNISIFRELYSNREVAFFDLDNILSLHEAIRVIENQSQMLVKNMIKKYNDNYTEDIMVNNYFQFYQKQLNKNKV